MGTEAVEMEQRRSAFTREYHGSMVGGKDSNSKRHYKKDSRSENDWLSIHSVGNS